LLKFARAAILQRDNESTSMIGEATTKIVRLNINPQVAGNAPDDRYDRSVMEDVPNVRAHAHRSVAVQDLALSRELRGIDLVIWLYAALDSPAAQAG
jgi:hypothetical protein